MGSVMTEETKLCFPDQVTVKMCYLWKYLMSKNQEVNVPFVPGIVPVVIRGVASPGLVYSTFFYRL